MTNIFLDNSNNVVALHKPGEAPYIQNQLHGTVMNVTYGDHILNMGGGADVLIAGATHVGDTIFANAGNDMLVDKLYVRSKPFYGNPFVNEGNTAKGTYYWALGANDETRNNTYNLKGDVLWATAAKTITEYHGPGVKGHPMYVSDFNRHIQTIRMDGDLDVFRFTEDSTVKVNGKYVTTINTVVAKTHDAPAAFPGDHPEVRIGFTAHDKDGYQTQFGHVSKQMFTNDDYFRISTTHNTQAEKLAAIQAAFDDGYHHGGVDGHGWLVDLS